MAAGVIALVLEANPELRWRDVQHITIRNAQVRIRLKDSQDPTIRTKDNNKIHRLQI